METTAAPQTSKGNNEQAEKLSTVVDEGPAQLMQRIQKCRQKTQKLCSFTFIAVYLLCFFSLSSNPKIVVETRYPLEDAQLAKVGAPRDHVEAQKEHIQQVGAKASRTWNPISSSQWCIDGRLKFDQTRGRYMGLCFVKVPRVASNTLAGINRRIASNFAKRHGFESCIRHDGPTPAFKYRQRERALSFLWTFVRDPAERALSRVANGILNHIEESKYNPAYTNNITEGYILSSLESSKDIQYGTISEGRGGFQIQYTMLQVLEENLFWNASQPSIVQHPQLVGKHVKDLLRKYDFIGVVDRLDESLVVLQLLMGLETSDILYFSSRLSTQYSIQGVKCVKNIDPQTLRSPRIESYFQSPTWWAQNYGDLLLHQAASYALDRTIQDIIGVSVFDRALQMFQIMKQTANSVCQPVFPCSSTGKLQLDSDEDCYVNDVGCGYPCLDTIAEEAAKATDSKPFKMEDSDRKDLGNNDNEQQQQQQQQEEDTNNTMFDNNQSLALKDDDASLRFSNDTGNHVESNGTWKS